MKIKRLGNGFLTTTFLLIFITLSSINILYAQTPIDQAYFNSNQPNYDWDIGGSPYMIQEDITILKNSTLNIYPGVEVIFEGHFKLSVEGSLNAIGTSSDRIVFKSNSEHFWHGIRFDFSELPYTPAPSKLYYCDICKVRKYGTWCMYPPDPNSSGGAIYVEKFSNLEVKYCHIFDNVVGGQGGAIGIYDESSPDLQENIIYENTAGKRGGGVCMMNNCHPILIGNTIEYNSSTNKGGGGIAMGNHNTKPGCNPTISQNIISNNSASKSGGGVFICSSNPTFNFNTISKNTAGIDGGGVYTKGDAAPGFNSDVIMNNTALGDGGGIRFQQSITINPTTLSNCTISGNSASGDGGGMYSQVKLYMTGCLLKENSSTGDGGGAYFAGGSIINLLNNSFESNDASGNGGGILVINPYENSYSAQESSINFSIFKSNEAYQGSALYIDKSGAVTTNETYIVNNLIAENHATDKGAVYMQGNNNNTVFNHNTVTNNTATYLISGVCVDDGANLPDIDGGMNFHNNIIFETLSDIYDANTNQPPANYFLDPYDPTLEYLSRINYLNYKSNGTPNSNPFVSTTDYHLFNTPTLSPCIDAGTNLNPPYMKNVDLDGSPRKIDGDGNNQFDTDYGCYEYAPSSARKAGPQLPDALEGNLDIELYPNPAQEYLYLNATTELFIDVSIYTVTGTQVYSSEKQQINGELRLSVSDYQSGPYILHIRNGNEHRTYRFVIQ